MGMYMERFEIIRDECRGKTSRPQHESTGKAIIFEEDDQTLLSDGTSVDCCLFPSTARAFLK